MDQMLPSPYNIPGIGTPLHQPEEDQQILPNAMQQQHQHQQQQQQHSLATMSSPLVGFGLGTPQRSVHAYAPAPSYATPQQMMQPQTPQNLMSPMITSGSIAGQQMLSQASPAPLTPMTPHSADPGILPQLQNIVSTVNLNCKLDLKKIALHARNAEYNPKRFAAVIMRIREPRTTALIFSSGKMVCTGAKSEEDSRLAARKYARIIQKLGFTAKFLDFKIQNMVGSCDVKFPIRLEGLVLTHGQFSSYEPELFPGLIYRMVKPRIVLLIFVSGKVVLTGAKLNNRDEDYAKDEGHKHFSKGSGSVQAMTRDSSVAPTCDYPVKSHTKINITTKLQIIQALDNGQCKADIAREYGVDSQTIIYIYKQKDFISKKYTQKHSLLKEVCNLNLEQKLLNWFEQELKIGKSITEDELRNKALEILKPLNEEFTFINDWLLSFQMRHNISKYMSHDVCSNMIKENWTRFLKSADTRDIYIGGACALSYSLDYNSYLNSQNVDSYVSLLFVVNTVGSDMREAAVVGRELLELESQVKSLPVNYYYCVHSQVNYSVIIKYLTKWDNELSSKGKNIWLVLDVPESLTQSLKFENIIIVRSADLDYVRLIIEKIVECFKYHYRRLQISRTLTYGKDNCTFLDYLHMIGNAWHSVPQKYVQSLCLPPAEGNLYFNVEDDNDNDHSILQWCKQYNVSLNVDKNPSSLDKYIYCDKKLPCVYCDQLDESMQAIEVLSQKACQSTSGMDAFQAMKRLLSYLQGEGAGDSIMKYAKYLENQMEYGALLQMHQIITSTNDSM
ncbi:unnamed protein product [Arctia plantaginis]|uniref:TATA-box-binding protein n=14 Tax=Endopterygota TaxID=33392 RepID=A0A8S1AN60_ARCPL|nr:unnamed protein product [Arctia plantaginis]